MIDPTLVIATSLAIIAAVQLGQMALSLVEHVHRSRARRRDVTHRQRIEQLMREVTALQARGLGAIEKQVDEIFPGDEWKRGDAEDDVDDDLPENLGR